MKNGKILKVIRHDNTTFEVGQKLPFNGGITIKDFEYQQIGDLIIAVFSDNKIGLDGLRAIPDKLRDANKISDKLYRCIPISERLPALDAYYHVIIDNDHKVTAWWFSNIEEWGKHKDQKGELVQSMVTHWLEEIELTKGASSKWIDVNVLIPKGECIALDGDREQWIGNLWRDDSGAVICEFCNPNGDSETIKIMGITHWTEKPKNPLK